LLAKNESTKPDEANENNLSTSMNKLSLNKLAFELNSTSLDWKSARNYSHCSCSSTFDFVNKKINCWKCGETFCNRCVKSFTTQPGYSISGYISLCNKCQNILKDLPDTYINLDSISHSNSIEKVLYVSISETSNSNSINNDF
jgi:hypothetical protein